MFSSALKSFSSNITSNYSIAPQPSSSSGPWKIFDAKKKDKTGKAVSVFVFDKKSLEPPGGSLGGRSGAASVKRVHEEVIERLRKEASSLARLRHPSILELAEPVEETRNGGLMFATEPVTASLATFLAEKDEKERPGRSGARSGRYVVEETDGAQRRKELEIDELEIQKGLLQIGKGLEFLHESAGLVHANLTPEAIFVNAKSDWKISGLAFAGPASDSNKPSSIAPISLSEVLNHDPRLPRSVQMDLDYTSPDFILDNNLTSSADMFSLGLLIVSLYNSPHRSPLDVSGSLSSYKRVFASSVTVPNENNNYGSSGQLPKYLVSDLLPRLITRRPAQRLTAKDFQQAEYFDNILVSTIRFLDALPAKTANEKAQFMRGLPRIMPQFPASVLEKKVLPALLEEMKDRDLLALILQNIFAITKALPSGKHFFIEQIVPKLREVFLTAAVNKASALEKDTTKEAGLMVVLEQIGVVAENTSGKEFRDDILPIIAMGLGSSTHALIDAALSTLPMVLPVLDYSTIKNELFPVIANVFAHTNSLAIKIRGLEAFYTLCGGTDEPDAPIGDGLDGNLTQHPGSRVNSSAVLDKFTIQEKIMPLMKAIKTKEPGVMMAALKVFKQVGKVVDTDFLAMDVLPILWSFSLGPLLDLAQFQTFMSLIKTLSSRIEREQTRKLQELSSGNAAPSQRITRVQNGSNTAALATTNGDEVDFESLVTGRAASNGTPDMINDWNAQAARPSNARTVSQPKAAEAPAFSWSTPTSTKASSSPSQPMSKGLRPQATAIRSITPDQSLNAFAALTPSSPFSQPLQPSRMGTSNIATTSPPLRPTPQPYSASSINWSVASNNSTNAWAGSTTQPNYASTPSYGQQPSAFSIAPPPMSPPLQTPIRAPQSMNTVFRPALNTQSSAPGPTQSARQGLDKYESLL